MAILILLLTILETIKAETMHIQDLTNNNGYIPIKIGEFRPIEHYNKVLHIVNLTEYEQTLELITNNVNTLRGTTTETKTLLATVDKNLALLEAKISNLHPHFKSKRGLVNIMGKGLKIIAGTMDNDDEIRIKEKLQSLFDKNVNLTNDMDRLTYVSDSISRQIRNITDHINFQQSSISKYLDKFKDIIRNKIATLEDEVTFMSQVYQVNNDITLFRDHVDNIGQIIFSSKLGIIPTDILTETELNLITDFESYVKIKVAVAFHDGNLVIILQIPKYSDLTLDRIKFEPIPDPFNKSILLNTDEIFVDTDNRIYETDVKDNLLQNLREIDNECLSNIVKFKEANCPMKILKEQEVIQILSGVLIFKNFFSNISHNCNKFKIKQKGNFIIKFENCQIETLNKTYTNINIRIYDKIILPNIITKIKENNTIALSDIKLETLFLKQIKYENNLDQILHHSRKTKTISFSIDIIIIFIIIILSITYMCRSKQKFIISSEPHTNGGGVIMSPVIPLARADII